jgi:hypothetical protein
VGWLAAWGGAGLGARGNGALHLLDKPRGEPQDLAPVGQAALTEPARHLGTALRLRAGRIVQHLAEHGTDQRQLALGTGV